MTGIQVRSVPPAASAKGGGADLEVHKLSDKKIQADGRLERYRLVPSPARAGPAYDVAAVTAVRAEIDVLFVRLHEPDVERAVDRAAAG